MRPDTADCVMGGPLGDRFTCWGVVDGPGLWCPACLAHLGGGPPCTCPGCARDFMAEVAAQYDGSPDA